MKRIAAASQTGHGTNVIAGLAVGLESTCFPTLTIAVALLAAFTLGQQSGLPGLSAGVFGTAVATMGMLCTAVFVLSMNNFGSSHWRDKKYYFFFSKRLCVAHIFVVLL